MGYSVTTKSGHFSAEQRLWPAAWDHPQRCDPVMVIVMVIVIVIVMLT